MNILSKDSEIRQLQSKCDELSKQVDVMKQHINKISKAVADRYEYQANTFLDPYNELYITELVEAIRDI